MTLSIALVCEAPADRVTVTTLAERLIFEAAHWIEPDVISDHVRWRGFREVDSQLVWTDVKDRARELGIVASFRRGQPRHPYSQNALRAILVLAASPDPVDGIILVADSDNDTSRLDGLHQARDHEQPKDFPIVVGLAHTKRECWHIAGFEPTDEAETQRLADLRQDVGLDFRTNSHDLTAKHDEANDKRSAKRVLLGLTDGNKDRENACLMVPHVTFDQRGTENGLCAFLKELRERLVPAVSGIPPEASR
jgi:hypothetical protein